MKYAVHTLGLVCVAVSSWLSGCTSSTATPGTVRIRWAHDPETLDPLVLPNQQAIDIANLLHCGLLQLDFERQVFAPALADAMPRQQYLGDSLTLISYCLRPAATWDDGRPVTARDIEFTLKLMHCPGLPNEVAQSQYSFIEEIRYEPQAPRCFTLVCRGQAPDYLQASGDFPVLREQDLDPRHQLRRFTLTQLRTRPPTAPTDSGLAALARRYLAGTEGPRPGLLPGCGPYLLTDWKKDRHLTVQRKQDWWGDKLKPVPFVLQAHPEKLSFLVLPDAATATLALKRRELDIYPQIPAPEFERLRTAAPDFLEFYTASSYDIVTAGFNTRHPTLEDATTRQALSRLFDARGLLRATQLTEGQRTVGLINPADKLNYNDQLPLLSFSPAAAAALLRQAGWQYTPADGWRRTTASGSRQRLTLALRYRSDEAMFETIALQFKAAAAQLHIPVLLLPTESATLNPLLRAGEFDVYVRTVKGNPFIFNFAPILHSQAVGEGNFTGYGTPTSDKLIEDVAAAESPARRAHLLRRLQALLQQDAPLVPLFFLPMRIAANAKLRNLHVAGLKPGYSAAAIEQ